MKIKFKVGQKVRIKKDLPEYISIIFIDQEYKIIDINGAIIKLDKCYTKIGYCINQIMIGYIELDNIEVRILKIKKIQKKIKWRRILTLGIL